MRKISECYLRSNELKFKGKYTFFISSLQVVINCDKKELLLIKWNSELRYNTSIQKQNYKRIKPWKDDKQQF